MNAASVVSDTAGAIAGFGTDPDSAFVYTNPAHLAKGQVETDGDQIYWLGDLHIAVLPGALPRSACGSKSSSE